MFIFIIPQMVMVYKVYIGSGVLFCRIVCAVDACILRCLLSEKSTCKVFKMLYESCGWHVVGVAGVDLLY